MGTQNHSKIWKKAAAGLAVFVTVGSVTYLGLEGEGERPLPGSAATVTGGRGSNAPEFAPKADEASSPSSRAVDQPGVGTNGVVQTSVLFAPKAPVEGVPLLAAGLNPDDDKGRVLRLNAAPLKKWGAVVPHEKVVLPTPTGEELVGTVHLVSRDSGWYRMGGTLDGGKGTFELNASEDDVHGGVYLPELGIGYQIQRDEADVVLVERRLSALICFPGIKADPLGSVRAAVGPVAPAAGAQVIPPLNTRPGATGVIFVDFAGGAINSTAWSREIVAIPSPLSGASIKQVIDRVAEDFAPFDITVTTIRSVYDAAWPWADPAPQGVLNRRMRVVVTPTDTAYPGAGGVAKLDSWKRGGKDIVCWVFNQGVKSCADAISHEVGHTLGLNHHGRKTSPFTSDEYYLGHGGGLLAPTSWGPIMGAPYDVSLTQWSRGEYANANNTTQDDIRKILSGNNFTYIRPPGFNGVPRALPLNGNEFLTSGTLISQTDSHVYEFSTVGGTLSATVSPASPMGTGDFQLELIDGSGASIVVSNPVDALGGAVSRRLAAGNYWLRVTPTGTGPRPSGGYITGYSAYGSLGGYSLSGTVEGVKRLPVFLSPKLLSGVELEPLSLRFDVTDPGKTTVTKAAENLPQGLTFDPSTLTLSGTPVQAKSIGIWSLTLVARNEFGDTRTEFSLVISKRGEGTLGDALGKTVSDLSTSPLSPWTSVSRTLPNGSSGSVAESGPVPNGGSSSLSCVYTLPAPPVLSGGRAPLNVMSFYWQSDTEPGKDVVQCRVDGLLARDMITGQPLVLSGNRGWTKQTLLLPGTGTRRIEFVYTKDANLRVGQDKVWVYGIEIGQPPLISVPPVSSLRVTPGTAVGSGSFSLRAETLGAKSVAWWKNGVALSNGGTPTGSMLSGVNSGTLTVSGAKAGDAGSYWLVAKNDWGTVSSSRTEVVVWAPPTFDSQPVAPAGLRVGDPLFLTAVVSGAQPILYQWKKDGVAGRWSSTPSLTISRTTAVSAGKYVLVAVSPNGTVSSNEVTVSFSQPVVKTVASPR